MTLVQRLEQMYRAAHPGPAPAAALMARDEPPQSSGAFHIFLPQKRKDYYESLQRNPSKKPRSRGKECRLCRQLPSPGVVFDDHIFLRADPYPMFDHHMLMMPLRVNASLADLEDRPASHVEGIVTREMIDCRELPTRQDVESCVKFVRETDYMVMQSMRGSGASVPEHIHSHAYKKDLMRFPLIDNGEWKLFASGQGCTASRLSDPSFAFMLSGAPDLQGAIVERLLAEFDYPLNMLFTTIDSKHATFVIPRTAESPSGPAFEDWKFGVTEVLGLFAVWNEQQFHDMTYPRLRTGLRETTLQNKSERSQLEDCVEEALTKN